MRSLPTPRPFQAFALEQLENAGNNVILSAPTGGGKAMLAMFIIKKALDQGKKVLLMVDRIALIDQLSNTANTFGLTHNVIQGNNNIDNQSNFTIASIQTFFRKGIPHPHYDTLIVDECHSIYKGLTNYIKSFPGQVIGLTATPYTQGLGNVYNSIINCTTAHELTENGTLVKLNAHTFRKIDMEGAKTVAGEWSGKEVEIRSAKIYGDVVSTYLTHANGIPSICFCATIAHCHDVARQFINAGVKVGVYTSDTSDIERKELLNKFDNNQISILISVSTLSKGFDRPYIGCILDLRPLRKSLAEYIQMIGRGLRSCEGKTECLLFDFTGNIDRFLPDFEDVFFNGVSSLDCSERLNRDRVTKNNKNIKYRTCPQCGNTHVSSKCIKCNYVLPEIKPITVDVVNLKLEKIRLKYETKFQQHQQKRIKPKKPNWLFSLFS